MSSLDVQKFKLNEAQVYMVRDLRDISPLAIIRGFGKTIKDAVLDMGFRKLKVLGYDRKIVY